MIIESRGSVSVSKSNYFKTRVMLVYRRADVPAASIIRFSCMSSPNHDLCNGDGLPRERVAVAQRLFVSGVKTRRG